MLGWNVPIARRLRAAGNLRHCGQSHAAFSLNDGFVTEQAELIVRTAYEMISIRCQI